MNGAIGGGCFKYTGGTTGYQGISSKVNLNGIGLVGQMYIKQNLSLHKD